MFPFGRNKYREKTDDELVLDIKANQSSSAFAVIYERYAHLVLGTCMKYLKNEQEAEDITMIIFENLQQKLIKHEVQHFKSWLYRVTKNECLMFLRKVKRSVSTDELYSLTDETEETSIEEKELKLELLEGSLKELKQEQRICLDLFYLKDQSYQEISSELGIDIKQVKSAIQNGKRNLKLKLEEHNEFSADE